LISTIIHEMNAQKVVLKTSKVETYWNYWCFWGLLAKQCLVQKKEKRSNNYQLITA